MTGRLLHILIVVYVVWWIWNYVQAQALTNTGGSQTPTLNGVLLAAPGLGGVLTSQGIIQGGS